MVDNEGLFKGFGRKLSDVEAEEQTKSTTTEETKTEPTVTDTTKVADTTKTTEQTQDTKTEQVKLDWLGEVNKNFKTDYKSPDEFKSIFDKAKKADEYEPKLKGYEESELKYKKQLDELQSSLNPLQYFSSQEAFIAEQLRKQHPDKSASVLQDVVTVDNTRMSDLDVLIKNQMLITPNLIGGESGAREYILEKYGIDPQTPKEEWSITTQNKILIEANATRKAWNELKSTVKLPDVATPEQRAQQAIALKEAKSNQVKPLKETFSKFDKFTEEIEDGKVFEFNVPDEYKQKLGNIFDAYFVEAGLEPTKENLATMEDLKEALLLRGHFKQIYKTIEGDVETRMKAERDKLLNNTTPANTKTAAELELDDDKNLSNTQGFGKLLGKKITN